MSASTTASAKRLIPTYVDVAANTEDELLFWGRGIIRELIRGWRSYARSYAVQIKVLTERLDFLKGKDAAAIRELAQAFENPKFPIISPRNEGRGDPAIPVDSASVLRKEGATTLNVCGWCSHNSLGLSHANGYLETSCSFGTATGAKKGETLYFNTPCFLKEAPDSTFKTLRRQLQKKIDGLVKKKRVVDVKIKDLLALERRAEKKPLLPRCRPSDYFQEGDRVVCYIGDDAAVPDNTDVFISGIVFAGSRHLDGAVSVAHDRYLGIDPHILGGYGSRWVFQSPYVMHEWEFEYFLEDPTFARRWFASGLPEDEDAGRGFGPDRKELTLNLFSGRLLLKVIPRRERG